MLGGPLVDKGIFNRWAKGQACTAATNLDLFARGFGTTDRKRAPVPCSLLDVHIVYFMFLSYTFTPVRTFDPNHTPLTSWSTTWTEQLLKHDTLSKAQLRCKIFSSIVDNGLNMKARDAIYRVLTDSLPLGPKRCPRQGVTKGLCCLCYYLRGESCVETSLHLAFDCPYTQQILAAVFRAFTSATGTSAQQAALHNMSAPHICATYARPLVSGLLLLDDQIEKADLQEPFQNLIGITTQAIINRQHRNNDVSRPLESDPATLLKAICDRLKTVASGLYQIANSEEKRIEIKFDGRLPEVTPIEKFK